MKRMIKTRYFQTGTVVEGLESRDKYNAIRELLKKAPYLASIKDLCRIEEAAIEREKVYTTGIGRGVAIAHGKTPCVENTVILLGISKEGIDFESMDGRPTHIFFLLLTPENSTGLHLKLLARISRLLKKESFKEKLLKATSQDEVIAVIEEEDEEF